MCIRVHRSSMLVNQRDIYLFMVGVYGTHHYFTYDGNKLFAFSVNNKIVILANCTLGRAFTFPNATAFAYIDSLWLYCDNFQVNCKNIRLERWKRKMNGK